MKAARRVKVLLSSVALLAGTAWLSAVAEASEVPRGSPGKSSGAQTANSAGLKPAVVEIEEDVYSFEPADNGAGPLWCSGSTCLVRVGEEVWATGLETLKDAKPLNNCRWVIFRRSRSGWQKVLSDPEGRTREPCPLAAFGDGRVFLSANPTLSKSRQEYSGPARPEILQFSSTQPEQAPSRLLPRWDGEPQFTEHSYRSFAADAEAKELILFQNIGYTHAEWTFLDGNGQWKAQGKLKWPWGADYEKPEPIRVCYPDVCLRGRSDYFCGVSDEVEPNSAWRAYKKSITGQEWDYDFRRLFYTWSTNILTGHFEPWVEIASREKTCGWITPGDLWLAPDGAAHLLWTERALDERLRARFFADAKQSTALNYAVVRGGKVVLRRSLAVAEEGGSREVPGRGRFQPAPDGRLYVFYYVSGRNTSGQSVSENRLIEVLPDGSSAAPVKVPLSHPLTDFFSATPRGGSPPLMILDLLGHRAGSPTTISYARVRL